MGNIHPSLPVIMVTRTTILKMIRLIIPFMQASIKCIYYVFSSATREPLCDKICCQMFVSCLFSYFLVIDIADLQCSIFQVFSLTFYEANMLIVDFSIGPLVCFRVFSFGGARGDALMLKAMISGQFLFSC